MKKKIKDPAREIAEAHIIPATINAKEKGKADKAFSNFLRTRRTSMSAADKLYSQLLQIKYQMEDYVNSGEYNEANTFGYYLNEYIHALHMGKTDFSKEISLDNTKLSRLLHGRDEPNETVYVRLEIHSKKIIPAVTWCRVHQKFRVLNLLRDKQLHSEEKKHVKATVNV
ncbi:MAG: hypothetical protein U0T75_09285 [Chitinophagales bacterium]